MPSRDLAFARPLIPLIPLLLTLSCGGDGGTGEPTDNPTPTISAISRDSATAGVTPFSVTLGGSDFLNGVVGSFDGNARTTDRLGSGSIVIHLTVADLAVVGDHEIRAKNPDPTGGPTPPVLFHVLQPPPVPVIDSLSPDTIVAGSVGFLTLHVHGTGFRAGSVMRMNGAGLTTTFVDSTQLTTFITGGFLNDTGAVTITVFTPAPGGGTSTGKFFTIVPHPPLPTIIGTTPDSVLVGTGTVPITIRGTAFTGADQVSYIYAGNQTFLVPTNVTDTSAVITLDRTGLNSSGALDINLHTSRGWSTGFNVQLYDPLPVITAITPDTLDGAATLDTFYVVGTGFVPGAVVFLDGHQATSSTLLGTDSIRAVVDVNLLFFGGVRPVTVHDGWDGLISAPHDIAITSPVPVLDSMLVGPPDLVHGSASHVLFGHDFRQNGVVLVNGVPHAPTFINQVTATFALLPTDADSALTLSIAIQTPGPGGGTSTSLPLQVFVPNPTPVVDSLRPVVVRSDSGAQFLTLRGHGFIPGTVVQLRDHDQNFDWTDTLAISAQDDSTLEVEVPAPRLLAGAVYDIRVLAPQPTIGPSTPIKLQVWTTGVRKVSDLPGTPTFSWASDTLRGLMYGVTIDLDGPGEPTTLIARDPTTGAVVKSLPLPDHGARLFYGGASQYLYAICASGLKVCRIDLDAWTLDWAIDAFTMNGNITAPIFIAPQDAHPGSFALSVSMNSADYGNWVRVYDGTVPRAPVDTFFSGVHSGRFFGDTLVMMNGYYGYRKAVTPGAQSALDSVALALNLGVPGRILSPTRAIADGHLMDLSTGNDLGFQAAFLTSKIAVGPAAGRFYTASTTDAGPALELYTFDLNTGAQLKHVGLDGGDPASFGISPSGLVFLGYGGIGARIVESIVSDP